MTELLEVDGGTLAYEVTGEGPLLVLAHGMGDTREAYRFLAPRLLAEGWRVAAVDLRGCGGSSTGWGSYTRTAIAGDLLALVRHLGGPAVLVGHSIAGGAVTIAAAQAPQLVSGVVELAPFTRKQRVRPADFRHGPYRRGSAHLMAAVLTGSTRQWVQYLDVAHPTRRPSDWEDRTAVLVDSLSEPGRMQALRRMGTGSPADAGEQLPRVSCPVLVVQGGADPDWVSPRREGEAIVAELPAGVGRLAVIEGAGHYPHVEFPEETLAAMLPFLADVRDGASA